MKVESERYPCAGEVVSLHDHFGRLGSVRTSVVSLKESRSAVHADGSSAAKQTQTQWSLRCLQLRLSSPFRQLWRESVSKPKILVQKDRSVHSARNSLQALVTQVQARGHRPPNLSNPGETSWMEGEGPCSPLGLLENCSEQVNTKAVSSPHRKK